MTEMIQKEEDELKNNRNDRGAEGDLEAALAEKEGAKKIESPTLRTSQGAQVRGYLASIADSDFVRELQQALRHAQQITGDDWRLEIRADGVEIVCQDELDEVEVSLDSVLDLASESVAESCMSAAEVPRIKLPVPQPPGTKKASKKDA
ncbi:hypothetical protein [Bradymonas sediminis]|uniref:Uncharacterized protein n=1 Tax=Bradymonas sediminis TaxID=1548548 RepID=A0A2Z4FKZ6_9DELT|nr:hypothetical protein [Bradymonas sediminis]AWV89667.1 hypothetical protein DN745_10080 [Bradymonas sediminis]TDP76592.1 hypothetical protein DFR33_102224 [Bradymonas sediminis]